MVVGFSCEETVDAELGGAVGGVYWYTWLGDDGHLLSGKEGYYTGLLVSDGY